jgi:predicted AlkP superfamily phosphohydrolase/phosphomutase
MDAGQLHGRLVSTIREEFEHNVSQQVYVSDATWARVRQAKEETLRLINLSYEQTGGKGSGSDLSRRIFENLGRLSHTPSQEGLVAIKEEVRRLF